MITRTLRTATLALALSVFLVPAAMAFPEDPMEDAWGTVLDFIESLTGGGGDPENVNHEVNEWEGDGYGGGGGDDSDEPGFTSRNSLSK